MFVVNTSNNTVTTTVTGFSAPKSLAFNPSGSLLYVANEAAGTISVLNTSNNTVANTIFGFNLPTGVGLSASGAVLYVSNEGNNNVSVLATSNQQPHRDDYRASTSLWDCFWS
jgi:YVTN family beta-propeller protein